MFFNSKNCEPSVSTVRPPPKYIRSWALGLNEGRRAPPSLRRSCRRPGARRSRARLRTRRGCPRCQPAESPWCAHRHAYASEGHRGGRPAVGCGYEPSPHGPQAKRHGRADRPWALQARQRRACWFYFGVPRATCGTVAESQGFAQAEEVSSTGLANGRYPPGRSEARARSGASSAGVGRPYSVGVLPAPGSGGVASVCTLR